MDNTAQIIGTVILLVGALMALVGRIWLIVTGFQKGGILWGILIFLFNWLAGLIFCIVYKTDRLPLVLMITGGLLAGGLTAFPTITSVQTSFPQ